MLGDINKELFAGGAGKEPAMEQGMAVIGFLLMATQVMTRDAFTREANLQYWQQLQWHHLRMRSLGALAARKAAVGMASLFFWLKPVRSEAFLSFPRGATPFPRCLLSCNCCLFRRRRKGTWAVRRLWFLRSASMWRSSALSCTG